MLNQNDFSVYEVHVYLTEIMGAWEVFIHVKPTPPLDSLGFLETRIECVLVQCESHLSPFRTWYALH